MRRRPVHRILTAATAVGLVTAAPPALAAPSDLEQINRASGTAGAFGLTAGRLPSKIGPITNDGRVAFFGVSTPLPGSSPGLLQDAIPGLGLWGRDVVRNTTTKLTSDGDAVFTGIDRSSRLVGFITSEGLAGSADKNGKPDLYAYDPVLGTKVLVSRSGLTGRALGLTSYGAVTRGSSFAVFGTANGVYRRELLTGRTTKLGDGAFIAPLPAPGGYPLIQQPADQYVSNDGRTYVAADGVVAPSGTRPLPTHPETGDAVIPFVNEAGTTLTWQPSSSLDLTQVRQQDVRTGVTTTPTVPEVAVGAFGAVQRPTPDGKGLILTLVDFSDDPAIVDGTNRWDLASGTLTPLGSLVFLSRNDRFGFTGDRSGAYLVGGTTGQKLPGTIDLPAATAYVALSDRCEYVGQPEDHPFQRVQQLYPERNELLPAAATARFRLSAGPGAPVVVDRTVDFPGINDFDPDKIIDLPFADGAFRLELTVTLVDGRTITSRIDHAARAASEECSHA